MARVAINGLGRIGRATLKILLESNKLDIAAVNDIVPADNLAYLLKYDTVYGRYQGEITSTETELVVGGKAIKVLQIKDPAELPWRDLGVDLVFECTGIFAKGEDLRRHIDAGATHVILSAPAKSGDVATVVHAVNDPGGQKAFSCASCTTNCITPVVEIMGRRISIAKAIMTTVHAYTSTQAIVDSPARKYRRGRAGAANFVPTTTGAARATTKALPQYEGKFDGVAIRGPVPVGSIADIVFVASRPTSVDEVNNVFREEARGDRYKGVLGVSEEPIVSSDIIGDSRASIVDLSMTQVVDDDLVKVMSWYDNEWGYACQMVREAASVLSA